MINRPIGMGAFQFVSLAALRSVQLTRGCTPRVEGVHKRTVIAQREVAAGLVTQLLEPAGIELALVPEPAAGL